MDLLRSAVVVVVAAGLASGLMLVARRRASAGGSFTDSDRASGVFGVIATGFSVLLGFLIFLAFESYDASRSGADTEALLVAQQVETAVLLPEDARDGLVGELVCYGRWVVDHEWDQMESGTVALINPWGAAMFRSLEAIEPGSAAEEAAYGKWLDQTSVREEARRDRIYGAAGVLPTPLWYALLLITAVVLVFLLFYADPAEPARSQVLMMASVVAVVVSMMLLLQFLDDPFRSGAGGVEPEAMERTLALVEEGIDLIGIEVSLPCDGTGAALAEG